MSRWNDLGNTMKLLFVLIISLIFTGNTIHAEVKAADKNAKIKKKKSTKLPTKKNIRSPASSSVGKTEVKLPVGPTTVVSNPNLQSTPPANAVVPEAPLPELGNTKDVRVIEVRKRLAMSNSEKNYKEFFINGGSRHGLSEGKWVSVERRVPVHDPFLNSSIGDMYVPVGELELIKVTSDLSVARLLEIKDPYFRPILEFDAIMLGDRLDLSTLRAAGSKKRNRFILQAVDSEYQSLNPNESVANNVVGMDTDLNVAVKEEKPPVATTPTVASVPFDATVLAQAEPPKEKNIEPKPKMELNVNGKNKKEIITIPK